MPGERDLMENQSDDRGGMSGINGQKRFPKNGKKRLPGFLPYVLTGLFLVFCAVFVILTLASPPEIQLQIDGRVIGIVESNAVVDSAVRELEETVSGIIGKGFRFPYEVRYSFVRGSSVEHIDKEKLNEILYAYLPESVCTGAGLYVDDALVAVCATEQEIRDELKSMTAERVGQGDDVGIFNEISVITQAYPAGCIISRADLRKVLEEAAASEDIDNDLPESRTKETAAVVSDLTNSTVLCDVQVPTVKTARTGSRQPTGAEGVHLMFYRSEIRRYQEEVPFSTEYTESSKYYTTMADVTTAGVEGTNNVEARVYYVDGREVRREIVSETVAKAPKNQVVTMGTRVLPEDLGITGAAGRFILPRIASLSSPYGERDDGFHQGWDIPGPEGANIYAAASGKVVAAIGQDGGYTYTAGATYAGYGYCVVIEHDNGYSTLYGHCSKICVTLGQEVKQGEKIAEVGETGVAYGPHVHFEIRKGRTPVDPAEGFMYEGKATIYSGNTIVSAETKNSGNGGRRGANQ